MSMPNGRTKLIPVNYKAYLTPEECLLVDSFFENRRNLKRGETVKGWILSAIRQESDIAAGKTQIDITALRGMGV